MSPLLVYILAERFIGNPLMEVKLCLSVSDSIFKDFCGWRLYKPITGSPSIKSGEHIFALRQYYLPCPLVFHFLLFPNLFIYIVWGWMTVEKVMILKVPTSKDFYSWVSIFSITRSLAKNSKVILFILWSHIPS